MQQNPQTKSCSSGRKPTLRDSEPDSRISFSGEQEKGASHLLDATRRTRTWYTPGGLTAGHSGQAASAPPLLHIRAIRNRQTKALKAPRRPNAIRPPSFRPSRKSEGRPPGRQADAGQNHRLAVRIRSSVSRGGRSPSPRSPRLQKNRSSCTWSPSPAPRLSTHLVLALSRYPAALSIRYWRLGPVGSAHPMPVFRLCQIGRSPQTPISFHRKGGGGRTARTSITSYVPRHPPLLAFSRMPSHTTWNQYIMGFNRFRKLPMSHCLFISTI